MAKVSRLYNYSNGVVADAVKLQAEMDNIIEGVNATTDEALRIASEATAGVMPDGSIAAAKVNATFGKDINISENPSVVAKANSVHDHDTVYQKKLDGQVTDFDLALTQGEYKVAGSNILHSPTGQTELYGKLIVKVSDGGTQNNVDNWLWQEFYTTWGDVYRRHKVNNAAFSEWRMEFRENSAIQNSIEGWCKLPNGMIMQWGRKDINSDGSGAGSARVTFPIAFTTALTSFVPVLATFNAGSIYDGNIYPRYGANMNTNGVDVVINRCQANIGYQVHWYAIGY